MVSSIAKETTGVNFSDKIPKYIHLYRAGRLKLDKLITGSFSLDKFILAAEKMRNGEIAGRCVIEMG